VNIIDRRTEQRVPPGPCTAWFIRGSEIRASVDVDENGEFDADGTLWNLESGEYTLLVTGRPPRAEEGNAVKYFGNYVAAIGVTLIKAAAKPEPNAGARRDKSPYRLASDVRFVADGEEENVVDVADLIPAEDLVVDEEVIEEEEEVETVAGGGGGGGGVGGGGGGLGWLGLLGLLGLLDDDDDNPPPASPAFP
jgi:hypothetical protein